MRESETNSGRPARAAPRGAAGSRGRPPRRGRSPGRDQARAAPPPPRRRRRPRSARRTSPSGARRGRRSAAVRGPRAGAPRCASAPARSRFSAASSISAGSAAPAMSLTATAPASSARRGDLGREGVGRDRQLGRAPPAPRSPAPARGLLLSGNGGPLRAATAPTSSMSNPASARATPSATAPSGVSLRAPSKKDRGDVDDPDAQRTRPAPGSDRRVATPHSRRLP